MENGSSGKALCPLMESYKYILSFTYSSFFVLGLLLTGAKLCQRLDLHHRLPGEPGCGGPALCLLFALADHQRHPAGHMTFWRAALQTGTFLVLHQPVQQHPPADLHQHPLLSRCLLPHLLPTLSDQRPAAASTATSWALVFLQLPPTLVYAHTGTIRTSAATTPMARL